MKIVDMHCDTISEIWESRQTQNKNIQELTQNSLHVDIQKLKKSGYLLQNFAMFVDLKNNIDPYEYVLELIDVFNEELAKNKNDISVAKKYDDIMENQKNGKISALLTIEEGGCCKGSLDNLETLYNMGARMMTLTWNYPNELGYPSAADNEKGLSARGIEFAEHMEQLGIIIDVSHLSDAGFWDIVNNTKKPFVASHSNARALCRHPRNLTDDMIRTIAERGGVIGLNYYGKFLENESPYFSTAKRLAGHARHILNIGGKECLGLGSDFDGIDGELEIQNCSQLDMLIREFERQHFTADEIDNILGENVLRVYRELI